ncbi:SDR family NAD(P)-dependent oxidoreductase [Thermodesulfobacteriota bacterium]
MERFKDKVAVVTGGAQGIGEAIAKRLAGEGATIGIFDIQSEKAQQVADDIASRGGSAEVFTVDITNTKDVHQAVAGAENKFEKIDILINNAGWSKLVPFMNITGELCDKLMAVNLKGLMTVTRAVAGGMINRNYGRIVNIASDAGRVGSTNDAVYSACKGGVIAITKTLAQEFARYNIFVNCISPGIIETPLLATTTDTNSKRSAAFMKRIPLRRRGKPEEVASAVAFFASEDASYITGQTLSVSGGLTMI